MRSGAWVHTHACSCSAVWVYTHACSCSVAWVYTHACSGSAEWVTHACSCKGLARHKFMRTAGNSGLLCWKGLWVQKCRNLTTEEKTLLGLPQAAKEEAVEQVAPHMRQQPHMRQPHGLAKQQPHRPTAEQEACAAKLQRLAHNFQNVWHRGAGGWMHRGRGLGGRERRVGARGL